MRGAIEKRFLTQEILSNEESVREVYVDPSFDWMDISTTLYVKYAGIISVTSLSNRLNSIWGNGNCKLRVTSEFDSLLLADKRLIYNSGKWVDV